MFIRKQTISLKSFEKVTFVDIKKLMQSSDVNFFCTSIASKAGCVQSIFRMFVDSSCV